MIYLLITILLNAVLYIIFKLFPKFNINALQAIVVNYITCVITGCMFLGSIPLHKESVSEPWFPWALLLGIMFIGIFNFMAYSTHRFGITVTTVANKLSLVIPVVFSVLLYNERLSVWNITGLLLAFPAVYFSTRVDGEKSSSNSLVIPALLFLVSGALDTLMKFTEHSFLQEGTLQVVFPIHVFAIAAFIGMLMVAVLVLQKQTQLHYRNIVAGIILGIPNYFSIYYFIRLLHSNFMKSSAAIPVNNIGIVLACAFAAIVFFKEPSSKPRIIGLALAVVSIILISLTC